jgi:hypothetical protein
MTRADVAIGSGWTLHRVKVSVLSRAINVFVKLIENFNPLNQNRKSYVD